MTFLDLNLTTKEAFLLACPAIIALIGWWLGKLLDSRKELTILTVKFEKLEEKVDDLERELDKLWDELRHK
jgi:hypothetical protein